MRIGKILVDSQQETHEARVIFAKLPCDIAKRKVLLLYPIMSSGNKVCRAVQVLKDHKVRQKSNDVLRQDPPLLKTCFCFT